MRNRVGSLNTRRPRSPRGAIERRSNMRQFPGMNGRAADVLSSYAPRSSWTSPRGRVPDRCLGDARQLYAGERPDPQDHWRSSSGSVLQPHQNDALLQDAPGQSAMPTKRRPEKFNKQLSRRPRRFPIDFSLLIGGTGQIRLAGPLAGRVEGTHARNAVTPVTSSAAH
jgi:hypothetical protein